MRRIVYTQFVLLLVCLTILQPTTSGEAPAVAADTIGLPDGLVRVICFGDSVTGVYYHTGGRRAYTDMVGIGLQRLYPNNTFEMVNAGISGNTTVDALARIDTDVIEKQPQLVTVMFGLNDMTRVPLTEYVANLKTIITRIREAGAQVLLCTPNSVIDTAGRPTATLEQYVEAVRQVGAETETPVADCYAAYEAIRAADPTAYALLMSDEIHPNMDGHKRLAETIVASIAGSPVDLSDADPKSPAIPKTLARLRAGEPIKLLAMPPYDELMASAMKAQFPAAAIEATPWLVEGLSMTAIVESAAQVREMKPDLVVLAPPLATGTETPEAYARSISRLLNASLSFGYQEWDCVVVAPSLAQPAIYPADSDRENLLRRLVRAQDLTFIDSDGGAAADRIAQWLRDQLAAK